MVGLKRVVVFPYCLIDIMNFRYHEVQANPLLLMSMPVLNLMRNPKTESMRNVYNAIVPVTGQNVVGCMLASKVAQIQDTLKWKD